MDFQLVLDKLLVAFERKQVSYALMGGFALGLLGVYQATVGLDFLINRDDLDKVQNIMTSLGYKCRHHTENVSQYVSPLAVFGEVDFLHAFREISKSMLERAEDKHIFDGKYTISSCPKTRSALKFKLWLTTKEDGTMTWIFKELREKYHAS